MATIKKMYSVFVRQIPWIVDKRDLRNYFQQFGEVLAVSLPYDLESGLPKGFGTVWFADRIGYQKALDNPKHVLEHQKLIVFPSIDFEKRYYSDKRPRN